MSRATALLRESLALLAAVVAVQAALGFAGWLTRPATTALLAGAVAWPILRVARAMRGRWRRPLLDGFTPPEAALLASLIAALALRLGTGREKTTFLYDTLSFHLHFPAAWMHAQRLFVVPAVFGDVAPAYNPSNAELVFHLLMSPLRSDYLAGEGQLPFAAIACLAILATVRELGGTRAAGLSAALAFLLVPEVWQQAATAMVDLAVAALWLSALAFLVRLWRQPAAAEVRTLALASGLLAGTKFVALPLAAPLGAVALAALLRHRRRLPPARRLAGEAALAVALLMATGGFWYLRNAIVAGNPLYPVTVRLGGLTLLDGLYDTALMRQWDYHIPVGVLGALGRMLLDGGVGFMAAAAVALIVRRRALEPPLALAVLAIVWFVVPYQHSRFLFAFFGVAAIAMGAAASRARPGAALALVAAATVGSVVEWPAPDRLALLGFGVAGAVLPAIDRRFSLRIPAAVAGLAFAAVIAAGAPAYRARSPRYAVGDELDLGWAWIREHVRGAHVAYAGVNLPFPLHGRDLANRVSYANVALGPEARLHDFHRRERALGRAGAVDSAEPAIYRRDARPEAWLANLRALGVDTLFVSSLYPIVARNVEHDADGYPVERAWADERPDSFRLRYANEGVRIYKVRTER